MNINNENLSDINCELCMLTQENDFKTEFFYIDDVVTVVRCLSDNEVMIVLNHHGPATEYELGHMEGVAGALFIYESIRKTPRKIKDHVHWHLQNAQHVGCGTAEFFGEEL